MFFDERRIHFLRDRVQRRLKVCQLDSFYSYYRLLTSREGKTELTALLDNLIVNETSFFRVQPQLELFQKTILEEILHRETGTARLVFARLERGLLDGAGALHAWPC